MNATTGKFNEVLATVEKLPVEDQATLVELVNKRIAAARRMSKLFRNVLCLTHERMSS